MRFIGLVDDEESASAGSSLHGEGEIKKIGTEPL